MEITAAAAQATTYTTGKTLAEQINDYLAASKTSIATLASEIPGYSRPTISRYLSGKYEGDISTIEKLLADWLAQRTGEAVELPEPGRKTGRKPVFYESRDALKVLGVCQSCQEYIGLGIVVARSGYGKTYSLRQYAKLPRVAYIECDDTMSSRDLVEAIEKSLGIPSGYGTIWRRVNGIRDFFNTNKGYLLIIDEADKLVSKYTQKKMEILRAIFDQSDVGLVIAGEPKLEAQIKTYLARMANRVDFYVSLKGLDPSEVEGYLEGFEVDPDAMVELKARACNMQTGCFRLLDRTLSNVTRILEERGERVVTVKIIEQASSLMDTLGQEETIELSRENWLVLANGDHQLRVEAVDGNFATSVRVWNFSKKETVIAFQFAQPEETDARATKILITPTWHIEGSVAKVEACNNAFDASPAWEDITAQVAINRVYNFLNQSKTAEKWGVNVRFTIEKNEGYEGEVSISGFGGAYE